MLCRLCAGCLNLHEAESWNKEIKGQVGVAIQTNIKVSSHSIVSSKPLLIGCNTTICPRSCVLWRQLWEPRFVLEPPQMYPSALCQVWAWPAQMSKHFPNTVASSCYTCNRAIWLIGLFICNWNTDNTVYIPKNKAPGTSPWIHFLNQSSLWPPLSHRFPLTEDFTAFGPYNGHGVEAAAAAGGADRLKLTNVIPDLLLSHTSTKPSGRPWPAPSLFAQLRICEKNFVAQFFSRRCAAVRILLGRFGEQRSCHFCR